jgi:hypothetical protein
VDFDGELEDVWCGIAAGHPVLRRVGLMEFRGAVETQGCFQVQQYMLENGWENIVEVVEYGCCWPVDEFETVYVNIGHSDHVRVSFFRL